MTTRRKNDVESTFVLHGIKSAQFINPPEFLSSPPLEVGLTKNLGILRSKFSQPIDSNYKLPYF
jgi:hypothetical protein